MNVSLLSSNTDFLKPKRGHLLGGMRGENHPKMILSTERISQDILFSVILFHTLHFNILVQRPST